jgi:small conductance mechanosensitive channel
MLLFLLIRKNSNMNEKFQDVTGSLIDSLQESWLSFIRQIPGIILAVLIVAIGFYLSKKIAQLSRKAISGKMDDPIIVNFVVNSIKVLLLVLFIMFALRISGLESIAAGILAAAGASAVILGFAFKDIGENFIAGIILSFNRPFNVNETVSVGDIFGKIKSIKFRYTKLRTFDGRDVYIPNSDVIKKPVYNYTEDGFFRFDFMVGIAYEDDITKAIALIEQTLRATKNVFEDATHTNYIIADNLGVSTVNLKVHFWVETFEFGREALSIKGEAVKNVKEALLSNGFSLPANINELKLYGTQKSIPFTLNKSE